jgi:2-polyprenyl-3-methyl-5-hydroxy-6-metoxy-1,4-benzoquinol methylase
LLTRTGKPEAGNVQVKAGHYDFERYDDKERWSSYWYQIRSALRLSPKRVLEIGSGTGVFRSYLRNAGVEVKTADIDRERGADFVIDVRKLDADLPPEEKFDVVAAFQVLEHIPYDDLEKALEQLARRAPNALVSLPYHGFQLRLAFAINNWRVSLGTYVPWLTHKKWDGEHYWELGWHHPPRRVTKVMEKFFTVESRGFVKENPYHYWWVLRSKLVSPAALAHPPTE